MVIWKRLGCPQSIQRTWWQIVVMPYLGFSLLLLSTWPSCVLQPTCVLLPDGTKPLSEPMLTYHQRCSAAFTWEKMPMSWNCNICLEITILKLLLHFPGANELISPTVIHIHFRLNHWSRVTHICVGKLAIIGSDNGLSPGRRQAIIWTNAGILLSGPLRTNFSGILIRIQTFSFKKMHLKM